MTWLLNFSIRRPRLVLALCLALTVAAAWFIPRIELRLNGRSLIPEGHPSMADADEAARRFDLRDVVVVALEEEPEGGVYRPQTLQRLALLSSDLAATEGIVPWTVMSLATVPRLYIEADTLDATPLLDGRLPTPELAARVRRETEAMGLADGVLVAPDGRAAGIYAEVEPDADRYRIHGHVEELAERAKADGERVHFSGTALAQAVLGDAAARDLARLVPLVVIVVGAVMLLVFRHPAPVLASLAEVGVSMIWTIGLLGALDKPVFVTTLALPVILVVIGVSDDIYALSRFQREAREGGDRPIGVVVVAAFSAVRRPVLVTSATTVVGLASLAATDLEPQRVFGLFGAASVVFSTLLTFTLVPAILALANPKVPKSWREGPVFGERATRAILAAIRAVGPRRVVIVTAIFALGSLFALSRLRVEDNWVRNLPANSDTYRGDQAINRLLAGTNTLELMVDAGEPEALFDPAGFHALGELHRELQHHPFVGAVESAYADVIRVNAALRGISYAELDRDLASGAVELSRPEIEQGLMLLASAGQAPRVERLDGPGQRARLTVFIRSANFSRVAAVLGAAEDSVTRAFPATTVLTPFGDGWISYLTVHLLVIGQARSIGLAVVSDTVLLVAVFGALGIALLAIAPVVVSVLLVFTVIAVTGTPLGTANSMFAAIALGVGVDYSIHLVETYRARRKHGDPREALISSVVDTGPAILTSALAIAAGFSILIASSVLPNRQLGWAVCVTMTACAVLTLVLTPSLVLVRLEARERAASRRALRRGLGGRTLGGVLLLLLAGAGAVSAAEPASVPDAAEIVARYNQRDFGVPGWRRIFLELKDGVTVTRTFTVSHLWQARDEMVRSLVVLEDPDGLRGTSYLLVEHGAVAGGMELYLHLPAGRGRVLSILPSRFDEGLLGSDFSYSDLRWRIPTVGRRLVGVERTTLDGAPVWAIDAVPTEDASERSSLWDRIRYYLADDLQLLVGADFFGGPRAAALGPDQPAKRYRVVSSKVVGGVTTPTRIEMWVDERRHSVLTLLGESFHLDPYPSDLFAPERLPAVGAQLSAGELGVGAAAGD